MIICLYLALEHRMLLTACVNAHILLDVWDKLGTDRQNVTADILKWNLNSRGEIKKFHGRNTKEREIQHETHHEAVHKHLEDTEVHAIALDSESMQGFLRGYQDAWLGKWHTSST